MATKHEQIIRYIKGLQVGEKISVRQVAKELSVSDGTAYRAIKEAENRKLVNTIERVGTIRIEKKKRESIERLTFAEVLNIVDGQVLGGRTGLHKTLTKFVIGAMQLGDMMRYVDAGSLLIVGNRVKAQETALLANAAVLITGGFDATDEAKKIADELELPIISTSYDTFTVATMLNRAIYDQMIEKEILLVADILTPIDQTIVLTVEDTIADFNMNNKKTGHLGYPVTDLTGRLVGIVTSRDTIGKPEDEKIEKVMTRNPITVTENTSVASAAHSMIWEGIDLLPVVADSSKFTGVVSREDVLRAFQTAQRQPHQGETIDDIIKKQMDVVTSDSQAIEFTVTPQLTNQYGTLSHGAMTTLLTESGNRAIKTRKRGEAVAENISMYMLQPVQLGAVVRVEPRILQMSRRFVKVDFDLHAGNELVAKAMVMYQLFEK
ncbi:DRTGG domain-containing protein [Sporosarcina pasteurii]|uniref:Putative manganese-dependent inorganic pyrophosphatase n=1 Tax=Sporosarcina pasteurii TaxID=1474 RepID=A0A380C7F1_SPOPA|nr:DRTGG domain-containing protein [Sporosarcina pasteurii]MDS9471745.1 DRTGG domain-containing protein [Sporosarcina pasteurii]QBQ04657.1 CBS domain-containing protein [Sporosarcina pasteurii]SUJ13031.1 putative manganese-dependent inorganic pyrophosphatase [Sporosarcina pasteurii]